MSLDYAALPPEVNSTRMYSGAGAGPLMAAAGAWDGVAAELSSAASAYQAVVSELTSGLWVGPSAASMAAAAASFLTWIRNTAARAEHTANQARAAIAAFEAAFAATVPPWVVAQNRATLAALVATNILGQNTSAIMATEAHYGEMWAQDAGAMYGYTAASTTATQLATFNEAPQTTNSTASTTQASAATSAAGTSAASQLIQTLGSSGGPFQWLIDLLNNPWVTGYENLTSYGALAPYSTLSDGLTFNVCGILFDMIPSLATALIPAVAAAQGTVTVGAGAAEAAGPALAGSYGSGGVPATLAGSGPSAALGRAASVGGLSVPQSWGSAAPEIQLAAKSLPIASLEGLPQAAAVPGGIYGGAPTVGPIGSVVNAPRNGETRSRSRGKAIAQMGGEHGRPHDTQVRWANFDEFSSDGQLLSESEKLRKAITAVARERDVLKRSAALLIKEALQKEVP